MTVKTISGETAEYSEMGRIGAWRGFEIFSAGDCECVAVATAGGEAIGLCSTVAELREAIDERVFCRASVGILSDFELARSHWNRLSKENCKTEAVRCGLVGIEYKVHPHNKNRMMFEVTDHSASYKNSAMLEERIAFDFPGRYARGNPFQWVIFPHNNETEPVIVTDKEFADL